MAIDMRIEIEVNSLNDQDVINYLKLVEGQDRGELVAKLLDFESLNNLKQVNQDLPYHELFELIPIENVMSTLGIRLKLLDKKGNEEKDIDDMEGIKHA